MFDLIENLFRISESVIDYPRETLDPQVWNKVGDGYKLIKSVKEFILKVLESYGNTPKINKLADKIHIVGSICTNQYNDDTDIDVHLVIPENSVYYKDENFKDSVYNWFKKPGNEKFVGKHPIEVYIQFNPNQELLSDGVYDIILDKWIKGPKILPLDYDPYDDFSDIMDDVRSVVKDIDLLMGELKRDIIDYDVMKKALLTIPAKYRGKLYTKIQSKLDEIENGIRELYNERNDLIKNRELISQPSTPEEALNSVELAKEWRDNNAIFKFVSRYKYLKIIKDLEEIMDDGIDDNDINSIKKIINDV